MSILLKRILSLLFMAMTICVSNVAMAAQAPEPNKGDTTWMLISTALVLLMTLPGLSLFYGGLTRSKNILSVMMQCIVIFSLITILWVTYGYSLAFTEGSAFIGKFDRLFLLGMTPDTHAATFSKGVVIPEYVFVMFQAAFATITCCLIVGAFAERAKFSAVLCFMVLWFTFCYLPIAHMVWFWPGPDEVKDADSLAAMTAKAGWLFQKGVLDFAGGTVVHINAAVAGLVGSFVIGKRLGYGKEPLKPHNLVHVMTGAALLWFGWFGFNAGSALEANGTAALAFVNTFIAAAAGVLSWTFVEWMSKNKPSGLGAASGCVAGLVAITPAAGFVGPMGSIAIGLLAGICGLWGVTSLKRMLGSDDSLDVFGIHGVAGILGAILTGVFASPALGGSGIFDYVANAAATEYSILDQVWLQCQGVLTTVVWSGIVSYILFKLIDMVIGLRVPEDQEREGLDITSHGESAYEV
ncbi:ammonium transporter [Orrella sp. NBD-18]|uniref:Ammonium transporter n=2 Tax=Sheuella amnicola TaxID=2707330 RepID=A0A6B2R0N1_9BURK|nr:ammonium transporter [Sheuella amnicola]